MLWIFLQCATGTTEHKIQAAALLSSVKKSFKLAFSSLIFGYPRSLGNNLIEQLQRNKAALLRKRQVQRLLVSPNAVHGRKSILIQRYPLAVVSHLAWHVASCL